MNLETEQEPALARFFERPQHIKVEVTNVCNANCTFCAYQFMQRKKEIMTLDLFVKTIEDYVAIGGGALTLSSVVGDCLVDTHLLDRVTLLKSYPQIRMVNIFTNLIALEKWDDAAVVQLLENTAMWSVSIGPNRDVYKSLYRVDRFEQVVSGLERLVRLRSTMEKRAAVRLLGRAVAGPFAVDERLGRIHSALLERDSWLCTYNDWGGTLPEQPNNTPVIRASSLSEKSKMCRLPLTTSVVFCDGTVGLCGCADYDAALKIGDLSEDSLGSIVSGRRRRIFLESFENGALNRYCRSCTFYEPVDPERMAHWTPGTQPRLETSDPSGVVLW